jgi:hypothetical protein
VRRHLPLIIAVFSVSAVLAACSGTAPSATKLAVASHRTSQSCTSTVRAWLHGPGGSDFRSALTAGSAMRAALEDGNLTRVTGEAQGLHSAASRGDSHLPPACANSRSRYRLAMGDWMIGALDARGGHLNETSAKIAAGAREIKAVTVLERLSPTVLKRLSRRVAIPTTPASAPPVAPVTRSPAPVPAASTSPPAATPARCYPFSDEGTCYEPGEYCRTDDYGTSGIAGDGEGITCEDNDGWRWEPA